MVSPRDLTAIWGLKLVQEPKTSTGWTDMNKTLRFRQYPVQYHQNPPRWRTTRCQRNGTPPSGLAGRELDKPERGSRKKIEEKSKNQIEICPAPAPSALVWSTTGVIEHVRRRQGKAIARLFPANMHHN